MKTAVKSMRQHSVVLGVEGRYSCCCWVCADVYSIPYNTLLGDRVMHLDDLLVS